MRVGRERRLWSCGSDRELEALALGVSGGRARGRDATGFHVDAAGADYDPAGAGYKDGVSGDLGGSSSDVGILVLEIDLRDLVRVDAEVGQVDRSVPAVGGFAGEVVGGDSAGGDSGEGDDTSAPAHLPRAVLEQGADERLRLLLGPARVGGDGKDANDAPSTGYLLGQALLGLGG